MPSHPFGERRLLYPKTREGAEISRLTVCLKLVDFCVACMSSARHRFDFDLNSVFLSVINKWNHLVGS